MAKARTLTAEEIARNERAAREASHARALEGAQALNAVARQYVEQQGIVRPGAERGERVRACALHIAKTVQAPARPGRQMRIPDTPHCDPLTADLQDYVTRGGIAFATVTTRWVAAGVHTAAEVAEWRRIIDADIAGETSINPDIDPRPRAERIKAWWRTWSGIARDMQKEYSK